MSRLQFLAVLTLVCVVSCGQWTVAGEPPSAAPAADQSGDAESNTFARIRQLIQAGEHLEAAGALDLAREARAHAESLLVREGARLEREREQLEELSRDVVPAQIMVQALIVEAKELPDDLLARVISQRGGELIRPDSATDGVPAAAILAAGETGSAVIQSLAKVAHIEILSRPQVIALDGMPAQIQIGQNVPVVTGFTISESGTAVPTRTNEDAGVSLTITPTTAADGAIRLELVAEQSRFLEDDVPLYTDPESGEVITSPVKDFLSVKATFTVPEGRTLFFPVSHIEEPASEESALLLLLQSRVVARGE